MSGTEYGDPAVADAATRRDVGAYIAALDTLRMRKLRPQLRYCFDNEYFGGRMRRAGIADPREIDTIEGLGASSARLRSSTCWRTCSSPVARLATSVLTTGRSSWPWP